jgi:hypothetical protein
MGDHEAREWGAHFEEADLPRRDQVPEPGFSRPSDVNANPELTLFVPAFRAKRRRVARGVTVGIVLVVGTVGVRLVLWATNAPTIKLRSGIFPYFFEIGCIFVGSVVVWLVWRWASARDPADVRHPH